MSELTAVKRLLSAKECIVIGKSTFAESLGKPLSLSYTVLFICLQGRAVVSINLRKQIIKAGDIVVLAEDSLAIVQKRSRSFHVFYCYLAESFAAEVAQLLPNALFSFLSKTPCCRPKITDKPHVMMWMRQLNYAISDCQGDYLSFILRNHLQNLFLAIAQRIPSESLLTTKKGSRKEALCWRFWELVGQHSKTERSVAFYANALSITPFYLSQITKAFFNDSPKDLINRQVILEIKTRLNLSDLSVAEIAAQLNFDDPSYLCRYFKRETGVSLTTYRKRVVTNASKASKEEKNSLILEYDKS